LAFDVALALEGSGESMASIRQTHGISGSDIIEFSRDPVFTKRVEHYRQEVREKGMTFRLKARAQAEELLTTSWVLIHDPSTSPAVKADLIKSTVKWAGLESRPDEGSAGTGGGVKININFGNAQVPLTLEGEVIESV
jgi:hypothetical protein